MNSPRSLIPAPGCQAASHARVIPNNKDSCPCVCGTITWATSRVSPCPLHILLPWVTNAPALPCPGEKAHGNDTCDVYVHPIICSTGVEEPPESKPLQHIETCQLDLLGVSHPQNYHFSLLPAHSLLIFFLTDDSDLSKCKYYTPFPLTSPHGVPDKPTPQHEAHVGAKSCEHITLSSYKVICT